jgi:competence protein ComEA
MDAAPPSAPPQAPPGSGAWPRSAQLAAATLLGAALVLLGLHVWGYLRWGSRPTDLETGRAPAYRIDLNRADHAELLQLPGVGPNLAERIETERRENGAFRSVDDLSRVRGVGPATLARLRPWVCVDDADDDPDAERAPAPVKQPAAPRKPSPAPAAAKKTAVSSALIDVNTATATELRNLPGIGPKLSQAIVDERERAPFKSVDDLRRVHGIGAKTLDKLRPYVTVAGRAERVVARE